jgi:uncharacterized protein YkwD
MDLERQMLQAANRERAAKGLPPLAHDDRLAGVARAHAQDMAARCYAGHVSPGGKTFRDRLAEAGLATHWAGENYYIGYLPAKEIVETALAWFMGDVPHRKNVLHARYRRLGVGVAWRPQGGYVVVLDFAGE